MSNKLWSGRFKKDIDDQVLWYTETTQIDQRLAVYDVWGSVAHLIMLNRQQIVDDEATRKILGVLLDLLDKAKQGTLQLDPHLEDVHLNVESIVIRETAPEVGGRLHTARSRNDQVVTDTRLYLRQTLLEIERSVANFIADLLEQALVHVDTLAIGYTHVQPAQPISYGYWLSAYASMYLRDLKRIHETYNTVNQSVLGACALAGTSFDISRELTRELLGFDGLLLHGLDATSSRDFVTQAVASLSILMANHSKLSEDMILWNSFEFGLLQIDDAFATGSSIMPQKKNAVVAELAKGKAGRVFGALTQILTTTKGVTSGYNCDLQEDKPLLWDALDTAQFTTEVLHKHILTSKYNTQRATELCFRNFSTVTELANFLTRSKSVPFREAHRITGELTQALIDKDSDLRDEAAVLAFLAERDVRIDAASYREIIDPAEVFKRQRSEGGTSPESVRKTVQVLSSSLQALVADSERNRAQIERAFERSVQVAKRIVGGAGVVDALG